MIICGSSVVEFRLKKKIKQTKIEIQQAINLNQNDRIKELNVQLAKLMKEKAGNKRG